MLSTDLEEESMSNRCHIVNNSCNRRTEEIERVEAFLEENGWEPTGVLEEADLTIFFTCGFCQGRVGEDKQTIEMIKKRLKKKARLIVGGCVPKTDPEGLAGVFQGQTMSPVDFKALDEIPGVNTTFNEIRSERGIKPVKSWKSCRSRYRSSPKPETTLIAKGIKAVKTVGIGYTLQKTAGLLLRKTKIIDKQIADRETKQDKTYEFNIATGCSRKCSYCAIRFAVGPYRSKSVDEVMTALISAVDSGKNRIELYGDSIGDYGQDIGTDFGSLLAKMGSLDHEFTLGIFDLHPIPFLKYYSQIEALAQKGRLHFLYVPIQSANPRILGLMRRSCNIEDVKEKTKELSRFPEIELQGCIIVCFPGETEEEFNDTVKFLKAVKYNNTFVHIYSDMPNTESSSMPNKVPPTVMLKRYKKLRNLSLRVNLTFFEEEIKPLYQFSPSPR